VAKSGKCFRNGLVFTFIALSGGSCLAAGTQLSQRTGFPGYPQTNLISRFINASLYLPDSQKGYYRGTRFDWSGLIGRVESGGHSFFSEFRKEHDPLNHDDICGTADEFGIELAPSYAEAKPGDSFIKIGVGVLRKIEDSPYGFWTRYPIITAPPWDIRCVRDKISFRQQVQGPNGWSYDYEKIVALASDAPELTISRELKNTGSQTIDTDQYDHNFSQIDDAPAGTNYTLEFQFPPKFGQGSKTQDCVALRGRSLIFTRQPAPDQAIWVRLDGFRDKQDNQIRIVNHSTGGTMTITTDQPLSKLVFYSSGGVLCPEPFVKISIAPGQTLKWTTTYRFEAR
jgi:hypothetical protein